jgi:hypothetical protein
MFRKIFSILLLSLIVIGAVYAESSITEVMDGYAEKYRDRVLNGETIELYSVYEEDASSVAFDGTKGKEKAEEDMKLDDTLVSGISAFVPYPDSWSELSHDDKKLKIINTLLSISTIKGITYISDSAGDKPRTLFSDAYTLTSVKKGKKAYDVTFSYAPVTYSYDIAAYLKDNIFGGNTYTVNYDISENEIFMTVTNVSKLKFLFFTAVEEGELDLCVDVLMTKEGIAIFGLATVRDADEYVETPVTDVHLPSAFTRRISSLKDWFIEEINK